jgi:hypothetical protein
MQRGCFFRHAEEKKKIILATAYIFGFAAFIGLISVPMTLSEILYPHVETGKISELSPSGVHLLEAVQVSTEWGGNTRVAITQQRRGINLLLGKIEPSARIIFIGGWAEFHHIEGFRWDGDNRVHMYRVQSCSTAGGDSYVFDFDGRRWRRSVFVPAWAEEAVPPEAPHAFVFQDAGVQEQVERFLDKSADEFSPDDFALLAGLHSFRIDTLGEPVKTLCDLPELFPSLRHIRISCRDVTDFEILAQMPSLRAVEIFADYFPSLDFAAGLPYVLLRLENDENASNLAEASVLGRDFIESQVTGCVREYVRVIYDERVYELIVTDYIAESGGGYWDDWLEAKVFVSEKRGDEFELLHTLDIPGRIGNASGGLIIADVNFDGRWDILVKQGHFGNQGFVAFSAFIYNDGKYEQNSCFSSISNPAIDVENERILSMWRNWSASHSWAKYTYENGEFVMTDILITSPEEWGERGEGEFNAPIFCWRYEVTQIRNGNSETLVYLSSEFTDDEFAEMFFRESSFWGLSSDRWRTLFNQGSLIDWSIYGGGLDAQITEIIGGE